MCTAPRLCCGWARIDHSVGDDPGFGEGDDTNEEAKKPDSWVALKNALKEMPEIITRALALLFESDLSELHIFLRFEICGRFRE